MESFFVTTAVNGVEFQKYNEFQRFLKDMETYYISQTEYAGYPRLWDRVGEAMDIFDAASDGEKQFIFSYLFSLFTNALSHWKTDIDHLYTEQGQKEHQEFMDRYALIAPFLGKPKSFLIGI